MINGVFPLPVKLEDESESVIMYPVHNGCREILEKSSAALSLRAGVEDGLGIADSGDRAVLNAGEFWTIGWNGDIDGMGLSWDSIIPSLGEKTGWTRSEWEESIPELVTSAGDGRRVMNCSSSSWFPIRKTESPSRSSFCDRGSDNVVGGIIRLSFFFKPDWIAEGTTNIFEPLIDFFFMLTGKIRSDESICMVATVILPIVGLCLSSFVDRQPMHDSGVDGRFFWWLGDTSFRARSYKSKTAKNFLQ